MKNQKQLFKSRLKNEKKRYMLNFSNRDWLIALLTSDPQYMLWKYHRLMRYTEFYYNAYKRNKGIKKIITMSCFMLFKKKRNKLGNLLDVDIRENTFDEGVILYHNNIIVNGHCKIGRDCKMHGQNIIGNNGKDSGVPIIGRNVDIGAGAIIIGDICIGDNTVIGAGAVVVNSFPEGNCTLIGVPAKCK